MMDSTRTLEIALKPADAGQPIDRDADPTDTADQDGDHLRVNLLGGLRVRVGETSMGQRDFGGAKPRRILLALLLQRGSPVSKDRLIQLLWDGSPPSCAKATLEVYVCVLRKKLQPPHGARASLITTVAGGYAIDMGRVDLDVARYERLISAALQSATSATDALSMLRQAMALAASPLLPEEVGSEWLDEVRGTHNLSVRKDLVAAATKVSGLPWGDAQRWARLALEGDPLNESAWLTLLASIEDSGQHADGLQAYDRCRRLFAAELGCSPGPGLQELYVRLLRGANEDNDELSQLLDAVVRLHRASRLGSGPPMTAPGNGISDAMAQTALVEQAFRAVNLLLGSVGGGRRQATAALGA